MRAGIIKTLLFVVSLFHIFAAIVLIAVGNAVMGACAIGAACYLMLLVTYIEVYNRG